GTSHVLSTLACGAKLPLPLGEGRGEGWHLIYVVASWAIATNAAARRVNSSKRPEATRDGSTSALPTPRPHAPACMNAAALSSETPPVGINGTCPNGPRKSFKYAGPTGPLGNSLTTLAPADQATSTSEAVNAPGRHGMPRDTTCRIKSWSVCGETMKLTP